jgi:biopolymer transport protein ExbD
MTVMCDVSFSLLSFFVMTATAKIPEALPVDTPASTVQSKLLYNLATITIGKGKVFYDLKVTSSLELMGQKIWC